MKNNFSFRLGVWMTLGVVFTSCSESLLDESDSSGVSSGLICFAVTEGQTTRALKTSEEPSGWVLPLVDSQANDSLFLTAKESLWNRPQTRAEMIGKDELPEHFLVTALIRKQKETAEKLFFRQQYQQSGTDLIYNGAKNYYWPGEDWNLDFYVVSENVTMNSDNVSFNYTVPEEQSSQKDLLVANANGVAGDFNSSVELNFQHACTAIQFVVKNIPSASTLESISLKGIRYQGAYRFNETTPWTLEEETTDFQCSATGGVLMMLPQRFEEDSEAVVEVVLSEPGKENRVYTAKLSGSEWTQGKVVGYTISIEADYQFELLIEESSQTVDAHYVIAKMEVNQENAFLDGKSWEITADNDATLLYESLANNYIKEGFWVDREILTDGSSTSVRGSSSITGTVANLGQTILVMIPENTTKESRTIALTVKINGKSFADGNASISQLAAVDHWEQIGEGETYEFGFNWSRKVYYGYRYDGYLLYLSYCQSIISNNNAGDFAYTERFRNDRSSYRCAIVIDYSKLSALSANSTSDGLSNTKTLKDKMGLSVSTAFEEYVASIKKTETGMTENAAFRKGTGKTGEYGLPAETGSLSSGSAALEECLKKNKYYIQWTKTSSGSGNTDEEGSSLVLDDLAWYLPAVDEFASVPTQLRDPVESSACWSSTVGSSNTEAYSGSNKSELRNVFLKVRAKRK